MHKIYAALASFIVVVALVWGFVIVGSPMNERQRKFDERRLEDLRIITQEVLNIVHEGRPWEMDQEPVMEKPLPSTLEEVASKAVYQKVNVVDPQTGTPYVYRTTGASTYELCATFTEIRDQSYDVFWNHPAGEHCFAFDALKTNGYAESMVKPVDVPTYAD